MSGAPGAGAPSASRRRGAFLAAVLALTVLGAVLRLVALGTPGVWFDEAVTLSLLRMDLGDMLARIPESESTPPLYYFVAWGWSRVLGTGEVGVRLLSAFAGAAAVPVMYAVAARLAHRSVGLAVATLVAVSPLLVWHSQDARAYSLLVLICAISLLAFARALDEPTGRRLAVWALSAAFALATHYFAVFLVAGEALWLVRARSRLSAWAAAGSVAVVAGALLPLALAQRAHGGAAWLAERSLSGRIEDVWLHFVAGYGAAPGPLASSGTAVSPILTIAAAVLALAAIFLAVRVVLRGSERRALAVGATLALASLGVPAVLALAGLDYVGTRNLLPGWLALAVVVGVGLGSREAGAAGIALNALLGALLVVITVSAATAPYFGRVEWKAVSDALGEPRSARAVVVPTRDSMPLALERPTLASMPAAGVRVGEIDRVVRGGDGRGLRVPGFQLVERRALGDSLTVLRLRSPQPLVVTPEDLLGRRWARRRTSALFEAAGSPGGSYPETEPPVVWFCRSPGGSARRLISIRTPCAQVLPSAAVL